MMARKYVFIGFPPDQKAYKVYDLDSCKIITLWHSNRVELFQESDTLAPVTGSTWCDNWRWILDLISRGIVGTIFHISRLIDSQGLVKPIAISHALDILMGDWWNQLP